MSGQQGECWNLNIELVLCMLNLNIELVLYIMYAIQLSEKNNNFEKACTRSILHWLKRKRIRLDQREAPAFRYAPRKILVFLCSETASGTI